MSSLVQTRCLPILMLCCSNVFMTFAWYGHLKHRTAPLLAVIFISWGIALLEYLFAVPANRWGSYAYTTPQLKIIQEVITLSVFCAFAVLYLGEKIRWNHFAAFLCLLGAVAFVFIPRPAAEKVPASSAPTLSHS